MFSSDLAPVAVGGSTVPATILDACEQYRERVALVDDSSGRPVSFAELAHQIDRIGAALADRGLGPGATVAIWAPNQPAWMAMAIGAMAAGCTVTGISPLATDPEAAKQLRLSGASLLVAFEAFAGRVASLQSESEVNEVVVIGDGVEGATPMADLVSSEGASPDVASLREEDVALLPFSSGTTGLPKGVQLTHGGLVTMLRQIQTAVPAAPDDAVLALAPFPHVMGMVLTGLFPLSQGATVVTMPQFDPDRFLPAIAERQVSVLVVPPLLGGLLAHHPSATPEMLSTLRTIGFGGAPMPEALEQAIIDRFAKAQVGQGYGMTELSCVAAMPRDGGHERPGSVGKLLPNTELRVVDPSTGDDLGIDAAGELLVRGPQTMIGYLDQPDDTAMTLDGDGWIHTGDLGRIDADGYIYVVDRIKELIKVKGFQVAPAELEAVLVSHPAIGEAAVTRVDSDGVEQPVAFVVAAPGAAPDPDEVAEWVAERVAPYKRLHAVHVVDGLPRNANGKIMRRQLTQA